MKYAVLIIMLLFAVVVRGDERRQVPHELFGVSLGAIVSVDPDADDRLLGLPGVKVISAEQFLGHGIHVYFKPSGEYAGFPYIERPRDTSDPFPRTSFRLYLLPIIPDTVTTGAQLAELTDSVGLKFEIVLIEWDQESEGENPERRAYSNARRLCETFSLDFIIEPEIYSHTLGEWQTYRCDFQQGDRMFRVIGQYGTTQVSLQVKQEIAESKQNALDEKLRRLELESIRPY